MTLLEEPYAEELAHKGKVHVVIGVNFSKRHHTLWNIYDQYACQCILLHKAHETSLILLADVLANKQSKACKPSSC